MVNTNSYDYINEYKRILADYKSEKIDMEQAEKRLKLVESVAYATYPDAEPDGDITYAAAAAWEEIFKLDELRVINKLIKDYMP